MSQAAPNTSSPRLMSVDALRGFDMLWIVGAGAIVHALKQMSDNAFTRGFAAQLEHVKWEGFHAYDLIFPLFLFIVGVSMVFSLDKSLEAGERSAALTRIVRRGVLLFALGIFYYGGLSKPWPEVQLGGVLHRIAACYLLGALIYAFVRSTKGLLISSAALLVGYWLLVTFVPFPDLRLEKENVDAIGARISSSSPRDIAASVTGRVSGLCEEGRNLTNYLDFRFLPGKKAQTYYINEGLLSTLPSVALTLFGALAGRLLKNSSVSPGRKIRWLLIGGISCIALGLLWSLQFPLIKRIWTSSFVLLTSGLSALLLALFYWLIDVRQWRAWCQPFVWIGCNALVIYLSAQIVGFPQLAQRFVGGDVKAFFDRAVCEGFGGLVIAMTGLLLVMVLARFLHRRQIFLRV